jgi:hypothetical protein
MTPALLTVLELALAVDPIDRFSPSVTISEAFVRLSPFAAHRAGLSPVT